MRFHLDKNDSLPMYMQLVNQLKGQIQSGARKPGEKLPTERELSAVTGLSRGTVKMAYQELCRSNLIHSLQGSGSFVNDNPRQDALQLARRKVDALLRELADAGFTGADVEELVQAGLAARRRREHQVRGAWVECCAELLAYSKTFAAEIPHLEFDLFPLYKLEQLPTNALDDYDLIVTAGDHAEEIAAATGCPPDGVDRLALTLSERCIISLATVSGRSKVAVWSVSAAFLDIMHMKLRIFQNLGDTLDLVGEGDLERVERKLRGCDVLIVPPEHRTLGKIGMMEAVRRFEEAGGEVIDFVYQLDRGSSIHLSEKVRAIYEGSAGRAVPADEGQKTDARGPGHQ